MIDDTELQEQQSHQEEDTIAMAQPITMQNNDDINSSEHMIQKEEQAKDNAFVNIDIPTDQTAPLKNTATSVPQQQQRMNRKTFIWASLLIIVLIVIVVLAIVLTQDKDPVDVGDPPIALDFSTGVSLVTSYVVNTEVRSRLSRTTITMEVANALDCSSIHAISMSIVILELCISYAHLVLYVLMICALLLYHYTHTTVTTTSQYPHHISQDYLI